MFSSFRRLRRPVADEQPTGAASSPLAPADNKTLGWALSFWPESDAG